MSGITQVSEHTFEIGGMGASLPQPPPSRELSAPPTTVLAKVQARAIASGSSSATDCRALVKQLRARLRDVKRELKAKKTLEQERDQLQRLIRAATTELDNVRRLRAAG
jgi:hypothetical protein